MPEGDPMANGEPCESNGAKQVLARMAEHPLWKTREEWTARGGGEGRGLRGVRLAVGGWIPGLQPTGATARLRAEATSTPSTRAPPPGVPLPLPAHPTSACWIPAGAAGTEKGKAQGKTS